MCQAGGKVLEKVQTVSTLRESVGIGDTHMPAIRIQYSNQYKESVLIQRVVEAEMKHLGLPEDVRKASEELAFDLALKQLACLTKRSKEFLG